MSGYENAQTVYAVQAGKDGPIKIGCCRALNSRMCTMQTDNAHPLRILLEIEGDHALERSLQAYLRADHMRGEWFNCTPTVIRAIRRVKRGWRPPVAAFKSCDYPVWGLKSGWDKRRGARA